MLHINKENSLNQILHWKHLSCKHQFVITCYFG